MNELTLISLYLQASRHIILLPHVTMEVLQIHHMEELQVVYHRHTSVTLVDCTGRSILLFNAGKLQLFRSAVMQSAG